MVDVLNKRILKCLEMNGRASSAAIGREVGLSSPAVTERIRKMEDSGVIKGYAVTISPQHLGYQLTAIVTIRAFMGKLKPFLEDVKSWEEVITCYRITGNENIVMKVALKNQKHLESFIDRVITYGESKTQIVLSQVVDSSLLP